MVRYGELDDLPAMKALAYFALNEAKTYSNLTHDPDFLVDQLLKDPSYGTFVAETEDGDLCGYMICQLQRGMFFREKIATNIVFYVTPNKRGTLIPYRLIVMFEKWAQENGVSQIHLGTSGGINIARNLELFNRLGYKTAGVLTVKEV